MRNARLSYCTIPVILIFTLLLPVFLPAQLVLEIEVYDARSRMAVSGAHLEIHETEQRQSLPQGRGGINLAPGRYHLHLEAPGFRAADRHLHLTGDTALQFFLQPTLVELQEVLVEESLSKTSGRQHSLHIQRLHLSEGDRSEEASLAEALQRQPGLEAFNTGVGIAKPVIRGFVANRVAVFDQGIRQEGQQWGMDHGLEIDPFNAGRIEVIKGASALQYGSDATGGVVKLLPDPWPDAGWSGSLTGLYRSVNQSGGGSAALSYRAKNQFVKMRLSRQQFRDYRVPADEFVYNGFVLPVTDQRLKNTAGEMESGRLTYGWQKKSFKGRLMLSHYRQKQGLYPGATGIPRAYDVGDIGSVRDIDLPHQRIIHTKAYARLSWQLGENWWMADVGFQQNLRWERSEPHAHGRLQLDPTNTEALFLALRTLSFNTRYQGQHRGFDYQIGLNLQQQANQRDGWEFLIPDYQSYQAGLFVHIEKELVPDLSFNTGARLDLAQLRSQAHRVPWFRQPDSLVLRAPALERNFTNYALATGLSYHPGEQWNFKFNLARSFRIPVAAELLSNGVHHGTFRHELGDTALQSETGWQTDLSLNFQQPAFYARLTPFFNYFDNYIFLRPSGRFSPLPDAGQLYQYTQAPVVHTGAELYLEYHPVKPLHLASALEYVYNQNLNTGLPLPFTPPLSHLLSIAYHWQPENSPWSAGLGFEQRLTAPQNRTDRNEPVTPGYELYNLRWHAEWRSESTRISLGLSVQNIFNTPYLRHLSRYRILNLPEPGRNVAVNLNFSF